MKLLNVTFLSNTISLYIMNFVRLFLPLLTIPYLTRILSLEMYGGVIFIKALMSYAQLFIDFGFLLSATKDIAMESNKVKIGEIVGNTIIEKIILSLIICALAVPCYIFFPIVHYSISFFLLSLIATLSNIFILDFLFRGLEKMHLVSVPYCIAKFISTTMTFVFIGSDNEVILLPIFDILSNIVAILISWHFKNKEKIFISFSSWHVWIYDLKVSFIFFLSNLATTVFGTFTTVLAGIYLNASQVAFWGICMQILSATKALYSPITNSLYPNVVRTKNLSIIRNISIFMIIPMCLGSFVVIYHSNLIMSFIGGNKYINAGHYLAFLLPAFIFGFYSMLYGWPVLGALEKYKLTTLTTIVTAIFQALCMVALIMVGMFDLKSLAIICSMSETLLFILRYLIYLKIRSQYVSGK